MVSQDSVLVMLLKLVEAIPLPPAQRGRGRLVVDSERVFLKALVVMIVRHLPTVGALLAVLEEPAMQPVRALLTEEGRYPTRRTWERRLARLPARLPAQTGRAAASDSTPWRACGGVWHKKDREAGTVPHTSIDTDAHGTKSGWHGWVYGWKLHLVTTVAAVWIPLAAERTPANVADTVQAPLLLEVLPAEVRFVLGDQHYHDPDLLNLCAAHHRVLVTTKPGAYPHHDDGVEVRRLVHELRSRAIENFNGQFKSIFDYRGQVPTRGLVATSRFVLGAVLVYQLAVLHRFEAGGSLRVGLKPFLEAA